MSNFQSVAILGLFSLLVVGGLMSKMGSPCGRGWLAFLMLPLAAASVYILVNNVIAQKALTPSGVPGAGLGAEGAPAKQGVKAKLSSFFGGKGKGDSSLIGYAIFLAFLQYVMTTIFTMVHKPGVAKYTVIQRSFIAAGISFVISMLSIFGLKAASAPLALISKVPVVGKFLGKSMVYGLALSPMLIIGALAAHGISCSMTK